jgi:3-phosphoshikimate 1-carboxyvinyltransferase
MRTIRVPGDKSISQRALILASLATGESRLRGVLPGDDPQATASVLRALGTDLPRIRDDGSEIRVQGLGLHGFREPEGVLDFENSGTGARLMLGVLAGQSFTTRATGDGSLRSRPMARVTRPLSLMGARFRELGESDRLPIEVIGSELQALDYDSPVASAQVKSALLLAGLVGETLVLVSEPRRSRDHTERMLVMVGAPVISHENGDRWHVELRDPPSTITPLDLEVPGDFSSAAFFVVLALLGGVSGGLAIKHVGLNPTRTGLLSVLARMGGEVEVDETAGGLGPASGEVGEPAGVLRVAASRLRAVDVAEGEVPAMIDEFPILAVAAARASGVTRITGASELRVKESDRIRALVDNLRAVGVEVAELEDGLEISGTDRPLEGSVSSHHDHRIAMAFGVLGALPGNRIEVECKSVVDVSFPGFWGMLDGLSSAGEAP